MGRLGSSARSAIAAVLLACLSPAISEAASTASPKPVAEPVATPSASPIPETIRIPPIPNVPAPPDPPVRLDVRGFTLPAGQTHVGDLFKAGPAIHIEGTQKGDVYAGGPIIRISGVVDGDVFLGGTDVTITGVIKRSARIGATNTRVDGTVDGNLQCYGASVTIGKNAHVKGNLTVFSSQLAFEGTVDGAFKFKGGTAAISGTVQDDAEITADSIEVDPAAHIGGDLDYSTRERLGDDLQKVVRGKISYDQSRADDETDGADEKTSVVRSSFGVTSWLAFLTASFLFGCALIAVFRHHEAQVLDTIRRDPLRCFGIGFVSVLVTIAVCLSVILLITLPFIVIYAFAYLILWYLARVPVALWLGRMILSPLKRPVGPYLALLSGLVPLHLVFALPYLGFFAHWFVMPLLGMGAMITVYLSHRQTQRAAPVPVGPPAAIPPAAPLAS